MPTTLTGMVPVLDKNRKPLMPCHWSRAKKLLKKGRAAVFRTYPFTIIMKDRTLEESEVQPVLVKIDPGSKGTGIAVVRVTPEDEHVVLCLAEVHHRKEQIHLKMLKRLMYRRRRRSANLRYRKERFDNRRRADGWLPPSLWHLVVTQTAAVKRMCKMFPVSGLALELVKFDTQKMQNPEISGIEYQQGELAGYEVKEYLLEKFGHRCVYCGKTNVPLNVDHVVAKACGGTDRVSNLVIACEECNQKKGTKSLDEFLKDNPKKAARIKQELKTPLKDAAAVNSTRFALLRELKKLGLPVDIGTGALTKYNRNRFKVPKTHCLDALCVGHMNGVKYSPKQKVLVLTCNGRGSHQRTRPNKYGFPSGAPKPRIKRIHGFATGDMVSAKVNSGKYKGIWKGRIAVRGEGRDYFRLTTASHQTFDVRYDCCRLLSMNDGYSYSWKDLDEV